MVQCVSGQIIKAYLPRATDPLYLTTPTGIFSDQAVRLKIRTETSYKITRYAPLRLLLDKYASDPTPDVGTLLTYTIRQTNCALRRPPTPTAYPMPVLLSACAIAATL